MSSVDRSARGRVTRTLLGVAIGVAAAVVITLNLHIWIGLEHGYAASPAEVFERSVVLGIVDIALLVAGAVVGARVVGRGGRGAVRRRGR